MGQHDNESRDQRLRRVESTLYDRAKAAGHDPRRARVLSREAVEQADSQQKKTGYWERTGKGKG